MGFEIARVQPDEPDVAALLDRHFALMRSQSPPESCHVLETDAVFAPDVHLLALRENGQALAIGAIRDLKDYAELKSMHTAAEARRRGLARNLLNRLMTEARALGIGHIKLETGSGPEHAASRHLYHKAGFRICQPFGSYTDDPLSVFMSRVL